MRDASAELSKTDPSAFLALILAFGAGLRRGEIDRLLWRQVDVSAGAIHLHVTEAGGLKSADSTGVVAIDETLAEILRGFRAWSSGEYVIDAGHDEGENSSKTHMVAPVSLPIDVRSSDQMASRPRHFWPEPASHVEERGRIDHRDAVRNLRGEPILAPCRHRNHRAILCRPQDTDDRGHDRDYAAEERFRDSGAVKKDRLSKNIFRSGRFFTTLVSRWKITAFSKSFSGKVLAFHKPLIPNVCIFSAHE